MDVITAEQARQRDQRAEDHYQIPALVLMENAGIRAAQEILHHFGKVKTVLVLSGRGNNGGDALVVARQLFSAGKSVHVFFADPPKAFSVPLQKQFAMIRSLPVPFTLLREASEGSAQRLISRFRQFVRGSTVIVDGLLGIGSRGKIDGHLKAIIHAVNTLRNETPATIRVVSLDIPSGLDATTGLRLGTCIRADLTITFDLPKKGLFLAAGPGQCGRVVVVPIGFPNEQNTNRHVKQKPKAQTIKNTFWITPRWVSESLREPPPDTHKGGRGKVLVIAGSKGMAGAAILCSRAALRSGAGLVYLATSPEIQNAVNGLNPEVITISVKDTLTLRKWIPRVDSVAIGPGLGLSVEMAETLRTLYLEMEKHGKHIKGVVVDADGLFLLTPFLKDPRRRLLPWILTPHSGEFSKLCGIPAPKILSKRIPLAERFAKKWNATLVLKGMHTAISRVGNLTGINSSGSAGLATAGSGDVLTGVIAALVSQSYSAPTAAAMSVYLHGLAGDILTKKFGRLGFTSGDLLDTIPEALEKTFAF